MSTLDWYLTEKEATTIAALSLYATACLQVSDTSQQAGEALDRCGAIISEAQQRAVEDQSVRGW